MKKYLIIAALLLSATAYGFGGLMMGSGTAVVSAGGGLAYESVQTDTASGDTTLAFTSMDYDAGDLVVVSATWADQGGPSPTGVSDGTNTWTAATAYNDSDVEVVTYWCKIATAQTNVTVTMTFSSSINAKGTAAVFTGSFDASPVDKDLASSGGSSSVSSVTSGVLSQATEVVYVQSVMYSGRTCTPDTSDGFAEISDLTNHCVSYKITSATTSLTVDTTLSSSDWNYSVLVSFTGT